MKRTVLLLSMLAFSAGVFAQGGGWRAPEGLRQIEIWPTAREEVDIFPREVGIILNLLDDYGK